MYDIINLSSLHELKGIYSTGVSAFADLANKYAPPSCCGLGFFDNVSNYLWVIQLYRSNEPIINRYKTGQLTTDQFLNYLYQNIFPFLKDSSVPFSAEDIKNLFNQRTTLLSLRQINNIAQLQSNRELIAKALLEQAWNAIIGDPIITRLQAIQTLLTQGHRVYLISNTNELNLYKILLLFQQQSSQINWEPLNTCDFSVSESQRPIEIAPNLYLCLSYRYRVFKNTSQQQHIQLGTPGLIEQLITSSQFPITDKSNIRLISQFEGDLEQARKLGLPNYLNADEFFTTLETKQAHEKSPLLTKVI